MIKAIFLCYLVLLTHSAAVIGVSVYPDDATEISTLIKIADNAMYQAKKLTKEL